MTPLFERQHQQLGRLTAVEPDPKFCSGLNKGRKTNSPLVRGHVTQESPERPALTHVHARRPHYENARLI